MSTDEDEDDEPVLIIQGRKVMADMLEPRELMRCDLARCQSYCCSGGVYIHLTEAADILAHAHLIAPLLPPERRDTALWFDGSEEPDDDFPEGGPVTGTSVVTDPTHPAGQTCIFLLPENRYCALQSAGMAAGEHPWRYKPFYCALHPLVIEDGVLCLAEGSEMYLEGGNCNQAAPGVLTPVYQLFDVETKKIIGDTGYAELEALAAQRAAKA